MGHTEFAFADEVQGERAFGFSACVQGDPVPGDQNLTPTMTPWSCRMVIVLVTKLRQGQHGDQPSGNTTISAIGITKLTSPTT